MQYDALIQESFCYKAIRASYRYFITSIFFGAFAGLTRTIYRVSGEIISNSETCRLFISNCSMCRSGMRYFIPAFSLSVLFCHIFVSLLISGRIEYAPILFFCVVLSAAHLIKKYVVKYAASIYRNSYTFRLINKKI